LAPANVNIAGQNLAFLDVVFHGPPDLNAMPHNIPNDLNAQPHQLNDEDFLELNDLINHVIHHPEEHVIFALAAPNAPIQELKMLIWFSLKKFIVISLLPSVLPILFQMSQQTQSMEHLSISTCILGWLLSLRHLLT
jgi:hypothetical protein